MTEMLDCNEEKNKDIIHSAGTRRGTEWKSLSLLNGNLLDSLEATTDKDIQKEFFQIDPHHSKLDIALLFWSTTMEEIRN